MRSWRLWCFALLWTLSALLPAGAAAPASDCQPAKLSQFLIPDLALTAAVSNGRVFLAAASAGVQIVDVSNPSLPSLVSSYATEMPAIDAQLSADGNLLFIAEGTSNVVGGVVEIVDVSDPFSPAKTGRIATADFAAAIAVSGGHAYVAAKTAGLLVLDVSNPASPALAGWIATPGYARGVTVDGSLVYVADWQIDLQIVDVSNPSSPKLLGSYDTPESGSSQYRADSVSVGAGFAAVALTEKTTVSGVLELLDVSNPAAPKLLGSVKTSGQATGVTIAGALVLVAAGKQGLVVVDASNPSAPAIRGTLATTRDAYGVTASAGGSLAYVAATTSGLVTADIATCQGDPPAAKFSFSPAAPKTGQPVLFQDESTGSPNSWTWDFGDGSTSNAASPSHAYAQPGLFQVTLAVTNPYGSSNAALSIGIACSVPCPSEPRLVLAGAAHAAGDNGTVWRSDLAVHNPGADPMTFTAWYTPFSPPNATETPAASGPFAISIAPNGTALVEDVLSTWFGVSSGAGILRASFAGGGGAAPLVDFTTFHAAPEGTYGQSIPAVIDTQVIDPVPNRWIPGLASDAAFRTNVGVVNLSDSPLRIELAAFADDGGTHGNILDIGVPPLGAVQIPASDFFGSIEFKRFSVSTWEMSGGAYFTYASRIDNLSGDPAFISDQIPSAASVELPGIASTPGAEGTRWKSRLILANPSSTLVGFDVDFRPASDPSKIFTAHGELSSFGELEFSDCLVELLGLTGDQWGRLHVTFPPNQSRPLVWASTYNDAPGGTYGQTILPIVGDDAGGNSLSSVRLVGVRKNADFRTNLGLVQLGSFAETVSVELLGSGGETLAARDETLGTGEIWQQNLFDWLGVGGDVEIATVRVTGPSVLAYASRIDNRTGDPAYLPAASVP